MTKTDDQKQEFLESLETDVDFSCLNDLDEINSFDELYDELQEQNAFDCEVIYYANAIEFLRENDQSLADSIEIAVEYGYELENINSEILASLLKSRMLSEEFGELRSEIEEFFND